MSILFEIMKSLKPTLMTAIIALTMFASVAIAGANSIDTSKTTQIKRLVIGPNLVDCTGIAPQQCMQILNYTT